MKYTKLVLGDYNTNVYLVWDEGAKQCVIIDPGYEPETIAAKIQALGLTPAAILLTHGHLDHVGGVDTLAALFRIPVWANEKDTALPQELSGKGFRCTDTYAEGDTVEAGGLEFKVLETPGHTPGSVCLLCEDTIFSGDTLFYGTCGRTDFYGGDSGQMQASLRRLAALEGDYRVLPGHGCATMLSFERQYNPFMR